MICLFQSCSKFLGSDILNLMVKQIQEMVIAFKLDIDKVSQFVFQDDKKVSQFAFKYFRLISLRLSVW